MTKPTVFLSHSSKDRRELIELRTQLDAKAINSINFFLASDDESIALGTLWPEAVRNALDRASLMFVFVSTNSLKSGWTFFEAGYGYSRLGTVVPFCLPGVDRARLPPPFGLLQARNLHSAKDLSFLVKLCNDKFKTKMSDFFSPSDFEKIFEQPKWELEAPIEWIRHVRRITVSVYGRSGGAEKFAKTCKKRGLECDTSSLGNLYSAGRVVASGIVLQRERDVDIWDDDGKNDRSYDFLAAPELIGETFSTLDEWKRVLKSSDAFHVTVDFQDDVMLETEIHCLSGRIFRSPISLQEDGSFKFRDVAFRLDRRDQFSWVPVLSFDWTSQLAKLPLADLLITLLQLAVLRTSETPKRKYARRR